MADYLPWAIVHLAALALILLCAAGFGNLFLRKSRFHNSVERWVFTVALGLGLCSLVLFILGALGILYQSVIWILTISASLATISTFLYTRKRWLTVQQLKQIIPQWKRLYSPRNIVIALLVILAVCYWVLLLIRSQYPPHNWDSTSNHLVIARANLTNHSLVVVPGIPFPVVPLLSHMLFTWAMALKDDVLAQMVVHVFLMLTAFGLFAWGKRVGRPAVGGAAAALWLAHPLIRELGSTAYVDIGLSCFVFLGVYALRIFWDDRKTRWWYLGSALFAFAAGSKITGLFFVGFGGLLGLIGFALVFLKNKRKPSEELATSDGDFNVKALLIGWTLTLLLIIPWFAYSAYETGNPLWPFFPQYSKGIWGNPWLRGYMSGYIRGMNQAALKQFFLVYIDFIRYPARFDAENNLTLLPVIVCWPLAWIVAVFNRSVRWWVLWALAFTIFWYLQVPLIRYWIPVLPFAGLALCESIQWIMEKIANSRRLHNVVWITTIVVLLLWSSYGTAKVVREELPPATPGAREVWLQRLNGYPGVTYINDHARNSDTVCVLSASWLNYYFNQRVIDLRGSLYGFRKPTFKWPNDQLWIDWMAYENVEWLLVYYRALELDIPKQDPSTNPFWPNYQLVFANHDTWVFRRKSSKLKAEGQAS